MPRHRRYVLRHIHAYTGTRPSAIKLDRALVAAGYNGPLIVWGRHGSNKRLQLVTMREAGVPTPELYTPREANSLMDEQGGLPEWPDCKQVIGRSDHHRAGSGFWFCTSKFQVNAAADAGATHFLKYIRGREFRVHIVDGLSIKLTEKIHTHPAMNNLHPLHTIIKSHANGWHQMYPQPDAQRVTLRRVAAQAVEALGLSLGAVDIILSNRQPFVLEVNSAPALTSETDTLDRYVAAIMRRGSRDVPGQLWL